MASSAGPADPRDAVRRAGTAPSPAVIEAVAGLSAGSMATLVVHPLDIVKTRMQIYNKKDGVRPSTLNVMRSLVQSPQPIAALYRGLTPNLLGNGTSWAAFFFFKSRLESALKTLRCKSKPGSEPEPEPDPVLSASDYFVASGLAGVGVQVLTNPLWVLKTRMLSSDRHAQGAYPSMWAGARHVWRDEGVRGFYRGLGVSLVGVSHGAVQFAVYEPLKRWVAQSSLRQRQRQHQHQHQPGDAPSTRETLAVSTLAKLVAGAVTYPYQVVRSRMQNYDAEARFGRGLVGVSRQLWRDDGPRGFYRGLVPSVVRVMPATWVTFLVYENIKHRLPQWL